MLLFMDEEFTGLRKDTTLISLWIVSEDGRKFYAECCDYDRNQCDDWVLENVISNLYLSEPMYEQEDQEFIRENSTGSRKAWIPYERPKSSFITTNKKEYLNEKVYLVFNAVEDENGNRNVFGDKEWIALHLKDWLSQFDSVQFVSDVCHYDFVLLIDLLTNGETALDLPNNVSAVCHDLNTDIARHYGISEREAFNKSREKIVIELCSHEVEGRKHNALYDAEVIKAIFKEIG